MTHVPWHEMVDDQLEDDDLPADDSRTVVSVGIDVGTTTTHLMLSELTVRSGTGHYGDVPTVIRQSELYRSPITLTPYLDETTLDADQIAEFVERSYRTAGYDPEEIDSGAVLVTGEARRKENAEAITEMVSEQAGSFVCAMAGPNLEAVMAAHGSGAVDESVATGRDVLHVDVGGGTTKLAAISGGFIEETAAIRVGGRLLELEEDGTVTRVQEPVEAVADSLDMAVEPGVALTDDQRRELADALASLLFEIVEGNPSELAESLMVTDVPEPADFDVVTFSGGVSEYVYGRNPGFFEDLSPELGDAIRRSVEAREYSMDRSDAGIRATVSGSTREHVQVSGDTIEISDRSLLPLQNVPMIPLVVDDHDDVEALVTQLQEYVELYDVETLDRPVAFGIHLHGHVTYAFLDRIATAVLRAHGPENDDPVILAFDSDVGMSVGRLVASRTTSPVITVDNVGLDQFGYLDISDAHEGDVPLVTMKSLVF